MTFDHLNPEQKKAVEHLEGPLLVLAGAGSGKTRVVTYRIAKLLEKGILPSDILAVTFTNKAAEEMRLRIQSLTKNFIFTSTFHSLGAKILRESIAPLGYTSNFTIYDAEDSYNLLKSCLNSLGIKDEKGLLKELKGKISQAKNNLLDPEFLSLSEKDPLFLKMYSLYQAKLKEYHAVDFDDLLFLTVKLLKDFPEVRKEYQNRWLFVLIDEYQDTNIAQYTLTKLLVEKHHNIFVVGDPDQAIYSWRGAKYQNILNFDKDFPHATIVYLEHNYRSTKTILDAANALISYNKHRYEKKLWSQLGDGNKIGFYTADNDQEEARFVTKKISHHLKEDNIPLDDMVIFYRTNAQSRIFEDFLLSLKIPYVIYGGLSFYQRREIKDILSFLRMIESDRDVLSFSRSIQTPRKGIGKTALEHILLFCQKNSLSVLEGCEKISKDPKEKLSSSQRKSLTTYFSFIQSLKEMVKEKILLSELISETIFRSGYLDYLKEDPETMEDRKQNLEELIAKAAQWERDKDNPSLRCFLEELSLLSSVDDLHGHQKGLKLMTLHNGKGLEFSLVFLVGMEEDLFPHINSKGDDEKIEEERRLCYVGMTRAKKFLYLCNAHQRFLWGSLKRMIPSRFLKEIPSRYVENLSQKNPFSFLFHKKPSNVEEKNFSFSVGDLVSHEVFGEGTIEKAYHTSMGETYDVLFEETNSTRSLVAKYAHLKKIF